MSFIHQLHQLLLIGDSREAEINREMYIANDFDVWISGELISSDNEIVGEYLVSPIFTNIIHKRPILVAELTVRGKTFRQPFYQSSGTATPEISPKGTWWPFSALWTPEYVEQVEKDDHLPIGWIGKYLWDTKTDSWVCHNKRVDRLKNYKFMVDLFSNTPPKFA